MLVTFGLCGFIASFAVGVGGTGWTLQGETFPTEIRGQAAATGATVDWLANFALIEVFPAWNSGIGLDWVLVCFAALSAMAIVFIYRYLPETKGMTVEEITARYEEIQASGLAHARDDDVAARRVRAPPRARRGSRAPWRRRGKAPPRRSRRRG